LEESRILGKVQSKVGKRLISLALERSKSTMMVAPIIGNSESKVVCANDALFQKVQDAKTDADFKIQVGSRGSQIVKVSETSLSSEADDLKQILKRVDPSVQDVN
jgi:hypothetical protein